MCLQVFPEVLVYLSLDGIHFQSTPVRVAPQAPNGDSTMNVTVALHNRVARFIRFEMAFGSPWLLISEVSLDSGMEHAK